MTTNTPFITEYWTALKLYGGGKIEFRSEFKVGSGPASIAVDGYCYNSDMQELRNLHWRVEDCEASYLMYSLQSKLINDRYPDDTELLKEMSAAWEYLVLNCKPASPIAIPAVRGRVTVEELKSYMPPAQWKQQHICNCTVLNKDN